MSWFGWGKKKETPEQKHKAKLDQLDKLGYGDRKKNLILLQQYGGNVNLVIQDYKAMAPSKSESPAQKAPPKQAAKPKVEPKPKSDPPPSSKPQQVPIVQAKPAPKVDPKPTPKSEPKASKSQSKSEPSSKPKAESKPKSDPLASSHADSSKTTKPTEPSKPSKSTESVPSNKSAASDNAQNPMDDSKEFVRANVAQKAVVSDPKPTVKAVQPIMPDMGPPSSSKPQAVPKMLFNLRDLPSSDIRQLLLNIDEPVIAEIVFSNAINGEQFYHYIVVNPLLKRFNVAFAKEVDYSVMVNQCELSYKKHGAVDIHNRPSKPGDDQKSQFVEESKSDNAVPDDAAMHETLRQNVANLVASDVRLLVLPYCPELAERLYAFSVGGSEFMSFCHETAVFVSGMKALSKEVWSKIEAECHLKPQPFEAKKWEQLKAHQEAVIKQAEKAKQTAKQIQKQMASQNQQKQQNQRQPPRKPIKVICPMPPQHVRSKLEKQKQAQMKRLHQMDREQDAAMPPSLRTLKERQMHTLTTLHDVAAVVGLDANTVTEIEQFARSESQKAMKEYLKSGGAVVPSSSSIQGSVTAEELEQRQLKLLSTIDRERRTLEKLAKSKGVSMKELQAVSDGDMAVDGGGCTVKEAAAMEKQLDVLFQSLAKIAESVQVTAKKYSVPLMDDAAANEHLVPMFGALEGKQEALVARLEYLNDQARMINPKAMEVNEEILQS